MLFFLYISFLYEIGFCFFLSGFYYYLSIYYYSVKLKTNQIIISKAIIDISTNVVHWFLLIQKKPGDVTLPAMF